MTSNAKIINEDFSTHGSGTEQQKKIEVKPKLKGQRCGRKIG